MTLARLLVAAVVVCSALAFAQKKTDSLATPAPAAEASKSAEITPSEPWTLFPNQPADASAGRTPLDRLRIDQSIDQYKVFQLKGDGQARILNLESDAGVLLSGLNERLEDGTTCYAIRSYVVARDNKDSDSTHPAGYSTCRPASRYHLRTAEGRSGSGDR